MSPAQRREAARKGGLTAHALGSAHKWTPDEARIAGRKGGRSSSMARRIRDVLRTLSAYKQDP
jgi:general stress protein YciG